MKRIILLLTLVSVFTGFLASSILSLQKEPVVFMEGKALGVSYALQYSGDPSLEKSLDSIINTLDQVVNIHRPDSELSMFNRNGIVQNCSGHLVQLLEISNAYNQMSGGMVSHSMLPLIEAWGRDFSKKRIITHNLLDSLLILSTADNIVLEEASLFARRKGSMIDLNYLDKGYLIDILSDFLRKNKVYDFQIEFGMDGCAFGKNRNIQTINFLNNIPEEILHNTNLNRRHLLTNKAYSTSGSFEKFYLDDKGNKHSHLINPRTGYPIQNGILSTHIIAPTALEADAFATMTMIQDLAQSKEMILKSRQVEGLIIYHENGKQKSWVSPGFIK